MDARVGTLDRAWRLGLRVAWLGLRVWWFGARPATHGVYVAVWSGERVLLVRHSYRTGTSLPGGMRRRGEAPSGEEGGPLGLAERKRAHRKFDYWWRRLVETSPSAQGIDRRGPSSL